MIPSGRTSYPVSVQVRGNTPGEASVSLRLPKGWSSDPANAPVRFAAAGDVRNITFSLKMPPAEAGAVAGIEAVAEAGGKTYHEGYQTIGYRELEPHPLFRPAKLELRAADVKVVPGVRVGYLPGAGDETATSLTQLGIPVQTLTSEDLANEDLSGFTAIVMGFARWQCGRTGKHIATGC